MKRNVDYNICREPLNLIQAEIELKIEPKLNYSSYKLHTGIRSNNTLNLNKTKTK